jgi:hypothetical protein
METAAAEFKVPANRLTALRHDPRQGVTRGDLRGKYSEKKWRRRIAGGA